MDFFDPKLTQALSASACWGLVPIGMKLSIETGDQRWMMLSLVTLMMGYWFQFPLLQNELGYAIVVTSAFTQLLAVSSAFLWFDETLTVNKTVGIALSLGAIIAFSLPSSPRS